MDLIKLVFDGTALGAIITVVIVFLRYQRKYDRTLRDISVDFTHRMEFMQEQYQNQIENLTNNFLSNERDYKLQIRELFNNFMTLGREMVVAMKELEGAVIQLKGEVGRNQGYPEIPPATKTDMNK